MAASPPPASPVKPATLALIAAALLVVVALAVRFWPAGAVEESDPGNVSANGAAPERAGDMDALIAQLTEAVRRDPDNHQGWFQLGLLLRNAGRFVEAEHAFRRAGELAPDNADYLAYRGEVMMVMARRDEIPPEGERLFRRALEIDPRNAQARYYLAAIRDLRGDHEAAIDEMIALLRDAPPGATWEAQVRTAIAGIATRNRIDVEGRVPPPRQAPVEATAAIPGPNRQQMEAARGIPPGQQDEMVEGMVDRLAARLRQNPRDANGWMMLMRSRMVMQQPDAARDALRAALAAFNGDAATQDRLRDAARQLGVPAL
ncbi:MAG TPA: tetratricopeptide repeat protein [Allosphingosinicella sp.]|nr:tetratricopeptide repeat protein [Allosphingosinicella sp.]